MVEAYSTLSEYGFHLCIKYSKDELSTVLPPHLLSALGVLWSNTHDSREKQRLLSPNQVVLHFI